MTRLGLFFSNLASHIGGGFSFQETLIESLLRAPLRHDVTIFAYDDVAALSGHDHLHFVRLIPPPRESRMQRAGRRLVALAKPRRAPSYGPLESASRARSIELLCFPTPSFENVSIPFLYTIWDLQHRLQPYFPEVTVSGFTFEQREELYRDVCRRASFVLAPNEAASKELGLFYGIPRNRVRTLAHPTPSFALRPPETLPERGIIPSKPFLFYPAQFWPHKNHVVVLEALRLLRDRHGRELHAVFTGSDKGNQKYVDAYAQRLGVRDQVQFLGFVPTAALVGLYRSALALVFPSFFGPENLPPLEAFALGCPVVASNVSGAEHQLGDAALLFDPRSEAQLVEMILRLEREPGLRDTLLAKGKARALAWTGDDYVRALFNAVDELASIRRCWSSDERYVHT